ncbi:RfbX Membrane protein involved in the export of O-antigen and teichoic acid [Methylophilaceae bacterium]
MRDLIIGVLKTGSGAVVNLLLGVISIKIMAVILGPSGTGLLSLIRQVVFTFASLGMGGQTALIQGIANKEGIARDTYVRTIFWLFVLAAFFSVVLIELFASIIVALVFGKSDANLVQLIRWIALPVFLMYAYIFFKSILNGFRAIGRLAIVEMLGPIATLMLVYPVCIFVGEGYALAFIWMISAAQLLMLSASLLILYKNGWLSALFIRTKTMIDRADLRYFFTITGTTFLNAIIGTFTLLAVRTMIVRDGGLYQAGLFDLAWSLSGSYVMLLLASFGTYYAPTLSQAVGNIERAALVRRVIRLSTFLMIPMIVTVVVLKPMLVRLLYTSEYMAALEMIRWMLIGDYLKITSWVLAIPVIVNADMKIYFWTETFWNLGFLVLAAISTVYLGELQGVGIAFVLLYLVLVIYYLQYVRRVCELGISQDLLVPWLIGFAVVIMASIQNWNRTSVDWLTAPIWIIGSIGLVIAFLKKFERKIVFDKLRLRLK